MNLTGEKIRLRLMNESDTEQIVRWRNNPRVRNNFIYQKPFLIYVLVSLSHKALSFVSCVLPSVFK